MIWHARDSLGRLRPVRQRYHWTLDEKILAALRQFRLPVASLRLYERTIEIYGEVSERVFYRHLNGLQKRGEIELVSREGRACFWSQPSVSPKR